MLTMAFPEPELAAQGACFGLECHIIGLTSVTIAGLPGGAIALMADTGEVFHLLGALTAGNRAANPVTDGAFVFAEKGFVYGAGILGPVDDGCADRIGDQIDDVIYFVVLGVYDAHGTSLYFRIRIVSYRIGIQL